VRGFVNGTKSYTPATKTLLLTTGYAAPAGDATPPYSYQSLLRHIGLTRSDAREHFEPYSPPWIAGRLSWVRGLTSASEVTLPPVEISDGLDRMRLATADAGDRHYTADLSAGSLLPLRIGSVFGGLLILGVTFGLVEWARKSLSARSAESISLDGTIRRVEDGGRRRSCCSSVHRGWKGPLVRGGQAPGASGERTLVDADAASRGHEIEECGSSEGPAINRGQLWLHIQSRNPARRQGPRAEVFKLFEQLRSRSLEHVQDRRR
jgi:hypothetical protein